MPRLKYTALHRAVLDCRAAQVRILIEQCGADINSRDLYGRTPLMLCCALDNQRVAMAMAKQLLAAEPDLGVKDDLGRTALAHACLFGRESLVAYLTESRIIDPTEPDNDGCTPLHHAAVEGNSRICSLLVRACVEGRSNVDCQNRLGCTPLMLACRLRRYHCALFLLLDGGASGFLKDNAHFLSALEWLRAAERQPLALAPTRLRPLRRAETAPQPLTSSLRSTRAPPTFLTEYSNLGLTRARTVASLDPLPVSLAQPWEPGSRPTTVSSGPRSRYTSATGDTVYVNVDDLSAREARDLLVERLRAQVLEFPYPALPPAAGVSAAAAAGETWKLARPTTRDLQALRPPPRCSAVANACQLLGLYHAAMTAPKPALAAPRDDAASEFVPPPAPRASAAAAAESLVAAAAAAALAAANGADFDREAQSSGRDRRASVMANEAASKKSVKFKDVAK